MARVSARAVSRVDKLYVKEETTLSQAKGLESRHPQCECTTATTRQAHGQSHFVFDQSLLGTPLVQPIMLPSSGQGTMEI
jgi:hypothetical protein